MTRCKHSLITQHDLRVRAMWHFNPPLKSTLMKFLKAGWPDLTVQHWGKLWCTHIKRKAMCAWTGTWSVYIWGSVSFSVSLPLLLTAGCWHMTEFEAESKKWVRTKTKTKKGTVTHGEWTNEINETEICFVSSSYPLSSSDSPTSELNNDLSQQRFPALSLIQ